MSALETPAHTRDMADARPALLVHNLPTSQRDALLCLDQLEVLGKNTIASKLQVLDRDELMTAA